MVVRLAPHRLNITDISNTAIEFHFRIDDMLALLSQTVDADGQKAEYFIDGWAPVLMRQNSSWHRNILFQG